jgi:F-type H+-transporting ATPase subunit a
MLKTARGFLILLALSVMNFAPLWAQHSIEESGHGENTHAEESFNAGKFVMEHVADSHEWHIVSFGNTHISIPLPVILYSKKPELHDGQKFHVFMSSKFHHGHSEYKGFRLSESEENEVKLLR